MPTWTNATKNSSSFSNQSKNTSSWDNGVSYLLKEDGDFLLLENGGFIISNGAERATSSFTNQVKN